jgi:hypothetical protein
MSEIIRLRPGTRPERPPALDQPAGARPLTRSARTRQDRLAALAEAVEQIPPLQTRIITRHRGGPPALHVVNFAAAALSEDITCRTEPDADELWFFWSWGDSIGPADDVEGTAAAIARVLIPEPGHA